MIGAIQIQLVDVLGKEPAGAFNKAQRLIERRQDRRIRHQAQVASVLKSNLRA